MVWIPRSITVFGMNRKRVLLLWLCIIILKEINHFFNSYRIFWNRLPVVDKSSNIGIRRIVHINRKRRNRIGFYTFKWVFCKVFIGFGVLDLICDKITLIIRI